MTEENSWVNHFITYNDVTELYTVWDETQAYVVDTTKSYTKAKTMCVDYAKTLEHQYGEEDAVQIST